MIIVYSGQTNNLIYTSRYNAISKYEILDHSTNEIFSGLTNTIGYNGKINHSGITYQFEQNGLYTYKSYWYDSGTTTYYLSNQTLIRCFIDSVSNTFVKQNKKNIFKTK